MGIRVLPSLSSSGFIAQTAEKADRLLSYFFLTEGSQSELYRDKITSLPTLIQLYNDQTTVLAEETQQLLTQYFNRYFSDVTVNATAAIPQTGEDHRTVLTIQVTFTDNGQVFDLAKAISIVDSKIEKITHLNNYGA